MGERESSIPRFAASTLSTPEFRWLHAEAWNDVHMAAFSRLRQAPRPLNLYGRVPFEAGKRRPAPSVAGRWLLEWPEGKSLACFEAQAFPAKSFRTVHGVVSGCDAPGGWTEQRLPALALVVSGVMIMSRADVLLLLPMREGDAELLAAAGWGEAKPLWSPLRADWLEAHRDAPPSARATALVMDPLAWWEHDHGAAARRTLSYLEKRIDGEERAERARQAERNRRPRGLFGALSRLVRW